MISPSLVINKMGDAQLVFGSAGSNRIRSAVIQVLSNYIFRNLSLKDSIYAPRLHLENNTLHIEPGLSFDENSVSSIIEVNNFTSLNLFFGGVNAVTPNEAVSDPRRGGCGISC